MHECIAHCPVCGRKFPIPVLGNLDQKVEIRCVCGHTFRVGIEELAVRQKLVSPALHAPQKQKENVMENELITFTADKTPVVESTVIAEGVQIEHKAVLQLIRKYLEDFQAFERVTFEMRPFETAGGTQKREVALLNENQAYLLFTYLKNTDIARQLKVRLVKAFSEVRNQLISAINDRYQLPQTYSDALRQLACEVEKKEALQAKIREDAPKVEFCDKVVADNDAMTITRAAKLINYPPRKLKDYIRQIGWLYANSDTPMQSTITSGYMVLRFAHWTDNEGNAVEKPYAHITNKGLFALYRRMRREGLIKKNEQLELVA